MVELGGRGDALASAPHRCQLLSCPHPLAAALLARRCCGQAESGSTLLDGGAPHGRGREAGLARHLAALVPSYRAEL